MKIRSSLLSFVVALAIPPVCAHAKDGQPQATYEAFDLISQDGQVCKTVRGRPSECFRSAQRLGLGFPEALEVGDQIKAYSELLRQRPGNDKYSFEELQKIGGAIVLDSRRVTDTAKNYRRLSLRQIALGTDQIKTVLNGSQIPFVGSLYWKGRALTEGTVNFEGEFVIGKAYKDMSVETLHNTIAQMISIQKISDTTTEQRWESLRNLEWIARVIHFNVKNGLDADTNRDTTELLQQVIGPVAVAQVMYVPLLQSLAGETRPDILKNFLEQILK